MTGALCLPPVQAGTLLAGSPSGFPSPHPPTPQLRPGLIWATAAPPSLSARVSCVLFSLQQDLLGDRSSLQCVPSSTEHVNDTPNPHPPPPHPQKHTHIDPLVYEWRCSDAHLSEHQSTQTAVNSEIQPGPAASLPENQRLGSQTGVVVGQAARRTSHLSGERTVFGRRRA